MNSINSNKLGIFGKSLHQKEFCISDISKINSKDMQKGFHIGSITEQTNNPIQIGFSTLFICRKGQAIISIYGKKHILKPGDIFIANWDMQAIILDTTKKFDFFYCTISEDFFYKIFHDISGVFCDFVYSYPILKTNEELNIQLSLWLQQILWIYHNTSLKSPETLLLNYFKNFFLFIEQEIQKILPNTALSVMPRAFQILRAFGGLLEKYGNEYHPVSFYAQKLYITPYYLSSITAKIMKESPKQLIDKQLILLLQNKLSTTNLPLKIIADSMNFEDVSYMNRYFKRHTGQTLTDFRNNKK